MSLERVYEKYKDRLSERPVFLTEVDNVGSNSFSCLNFLLDNVSKISSLQKKIPDLSLDKVLRESDFIDASLKNAFVYANLSQSFFGYDLVAAKVVDVDNKYLHRLRSALSSLPKNFCSQYELLSTSGDLNTLGFQREKVNSIVSQYERVASVAAARGLSFVKDLDVKYYVNDVLPEHKKLEVFFANELSSYQSINDLSSNKKLLKKILKRFAGNLFSDGFVQKSKYVEYFEGVILASEISDEVKSALSNPDSFMLEREALQNKLDYISSSSSLLYGAKDSDVFSEFSALDLNAFPSPSLYNQSLASQYKANAFKFNALLSSKKKEVEYQSKKRSYHQQVVLVSSNNSLRVVPSPQVFGVNSGVSQGVVPSYDSSLFPDKISGLPMPNDSRYRRVRDILSLSIDASGWVERLELLGAEVEKLSKVDDLQRSPYLMNVYDEVSSFYAHGHLGVLARFKSENDSTISASLKSLYSLAKKVA